MIYLYIYFSCLSVCLYPINVKTAKPIGPKFSVGPHITPGKVYWPSKLNKKLLKKYKFFLKMSQLKEENLSTIENDLNLPTFRATEAKIIIGKRGCENLIYTIWRRRQIFQFFNLYLDHVIIVAGSSHLTQHLVQLVVHHQPPHVVEGSPSQKVDFFVG